MACGWTNTSGKTGENGLEDVPEVCHCGVELHWGWWIPMILLALVTCLANCVSLVVLSRLQSTLTPVLRLALVSLSLTDVVGSLSYIYHSVMTKLAYQEVDVECTVR
ncbi:hypothetical protein ElyMa_004095100 [Elysia marginata]|uniref:G-protein coupled receptors family 1 profile domain-containing protein n=1 Tax=Elysia marginata TaxID=1093978 RepID=A0AAV4GAV2_9GAST|nr:hypothetical protein ElyMa_004095100 [Elysia marginata]